MTKSSHLVLLTVHNIVSCLYSHFTESKGAFSPKVTFNIILHMFRIYPFSELQYILLPSKCS